MVAPGSPPAVSYRSGKKTPGGAGTHTGHTRDTRVHTGTRITQTNLTTIQTHRATTHPHDLHTRRPKPRPTQQPQARSRPLPAADSEEAAPSEPGTVPVPVKRHRGEPGHTRDTHGTHTGAKRCKQTGTRITQTNLTTYSQPSKPNDTPARPRDGRNRGRLNSRKNSRRPGEPTGDRSPVRWGPQLAAIPRSRYVVPWRERGEDNIRITGYRLPSVLRLGRRSPSVCTRPLSGHRARKLPGQQLISSPRSLRFAAWSSAAPLAGGPGRSASSLLSWLRRRQPSVSGAQLAASSSAQRQWRSLGARSMLDARSFMISTLRSQVGFAAAVAHAPVSASRVLSSSGALGSGRTPAPPAVTHLSRAPSFRRPPSSRRGEALWERVEAGSGSLGAASSESAAGSGRLRACGTCSCAAVGGLGAWGC